MLYKMLQLHNIFHRQCIPEFIQFLCWADFTCTDSSLHRFQHPGLDPGGTHKDFLTCMYMTSTPATDCTSVVQSSIVEPHLSHIPAYWTRWVASPRLLSTSSFPPTHKQRSVLIRTCAVCAVSVSKVSSVTMVTLLKQHQCGTPTLLALVKLTRASWIVDSTWTDFSWSALCLLPALRCWAGGRTDAWSKFSSTSPSSSISVTSCDSTSDSPRHCCHQNCDWTRPKKWLFIVKEFG